MLPRTPPTSLQYELIQLPDDILTQRGSLKKKRDNIAGQQGIPQRRGPAGIIPLTPPTPLLRPAIRRQVLAPTLPHPTGPNGRPKFQLRRCGPPGRKSDRQQVTHPNTTPYNKDHTQANTPPLLHDRDPAHGPQRVPPLLRMPEAGPFANRVALAWKRCPDTVVRLHFRGTLRKLPRGGLKKCHESETVNRAALV